MGGARRMGVMSGRKEEEGDQKDVGRKGGEGEREKDGYGLWEGSKSIAD